MKLRYKDKKLIARWWRSQGIPDKDGYWGHYTIPKDIMRVYKKEYPKDWNNIYIPLYVKILAIPLLLFIELTNSIDKFIERHIK